MKLTENQKLTRKASRLANEAARLELANANSFLSRSLMWSDRPDFYLLLTGWNPFVPGKEELTLRIREADARYFDMEIRAHLNEIGHEAIHEAMIREPHLFLSPMLNNLMVDPSFYDEDEDD